MDFERLGLFVEVARAGSFAAAARRHDLDPSVVSRAISGIENELGTRLFHRTTRSLAMTETGQLFVRRAEVLLEEYETARGEVTAATGSPSGTVRLTASVGFSQVCIVPLVKQLRARHGGIRLDLVASDANLDLAAEGIDLAIRLAPRPEGDYVASKLRDVRYRVVASAEFARARAVSSPTDLAHAPCLCFSLPGFRTRWLFRDKDGQELRVSVGGPIEASTSLALREFCLQGLGPALLGDWLIADEMASGRLVDLFPDHDVTATTYNTAAWLLYPSRRHLPEKTRVLIDFLRENLGPGSAFGQGRDEPSRDKPEG